MPTPKGYKRKRLVESWRHVCAKGSIRTVKRGVGHGRGSVDIGCRYLHQAMLRPGHFRIHPRCTYLIEAIDKWRYEDDGFKDHIDALRYALDSRIFTGRANLRVAPVRLY